MEAPVTTKAARTRREIQISPASRPRLAFDFHRRLVAPAGDWRSIPPASISASIPMGVPPPCTQPDKARVHIAAAIRKNKIQKFTMNLIQVGGDQGNSSRK